MSDRAPSSRTDDWAETVLDKLSQVREVARKEGAAAILDGGDFFHIKSPTRNSHETVRRVLDHHADYPCPVFCTPGNHDSIYGDYQFLGQQPLGVLFSAGRFQRLYDEWEVYFTEVDGVPRAFQKGKLGFIEGSPFDLPRKGPIVRVVGIPYHGSTYDRSRFESLRKGDEDFLVCVAHVLASKEGGSMFEGEDILRYRDLRETAPDLYLFGHWHKDQGVEVLDGKTFVNIGSLTRGSLSQDEVQRRPACAVLQFGKDLEVKVVRLNVKTPEEVFDLVRREDQVRRQEDMDTFVTKIRDSLVNSGKEEPSVRLLDADYVDPSGKSFAADLPEKVRERALHYMELAEKEAS